jgi:hypothetical protein
MEKLTILKGFQKFSKYHELVDYINKGGAKDVNSRKIYFDVDVGDQVS